MKIACKVCIIRIKQNFRVEWKWENNKTMQMQAILTLATDGSQNDYACHSRRKYVSLHWIKNISKLA